MALTRDFRIKDGLNVGLSALFTAGVSAYDGSKVAINTFGNILSGGRDLADIFADADLEDLTGGSGINSFSYDGLSPITISLSGASSLSNDSLIRWSTATGFVNSSLTNTALTSLQTSVASNSANWNTAYVQGTSVYSSYNAASGTIIDDVTIPATQGQFNVVELDGGSVTRTLHNLSVAGTPTFSDTTITGILSVGGDVTLGNANTDTLTINAGPVNLPNATSDADALVLGTDVKLYRDSANTLRTPDSVIIDGNTTISGNLSVLGDFTRIDTLVSVTSALSVINTGTGPALYIEQSGVQPIAQFIDRDGGSITFSDTGSVGIGTPTNAIPAEKLTVSGSISAKDTLKLGALASGTTNSVVIESSGTLQKRTINAGAFDTSAPFISGSSTRTTNTIPKFSSTTGITNSTITDTGDTVTIGSDVVVDNHRFTMITSGKVVQTAVFQDTLLAGANTVITFNKTDLNSVKYFISLFTSGNIRTAFEVLAVYNGTDAFGTVYSIVDAQDTSLLTAVDTSVSGSTIDLSIAVNQLCNAVIHGTAQYTTLAPLPTTTASP